LKNGNERTSHWDLERLLRGDLPEKEAVALRALIAASPELTKLLASMREERPARNFQDLERKAESLKTAPAFTPSTRRRSQGSSTVGATLQAWLSGFGGARVAFSMAMMIAIGVSLRFMMPGNGGPGTAPYSAKGEEAFEAMLRIGSTDLEPDVTLAVKGSDTLRVSYRSPKPRYIQFWYKEDDLAAAPLQAGADTLPPWDVATKWTLAPKKILLTGQWKRQAIFIISSARHLSTAEALAAIAGDSSRSLASHVDRFRLIRQP
jgi:hypothetical protein